MKIKYLLFLSFLVVACGPSSEAPSDAKLASKKKELKAARQELQKIKSRITKIEAAIREIDPSAIRRNVTLVSTLKAEQQPFEHKIQVRGDVQSRKNIQISAQSAGTVERIYVKEGQRVKKGQVLISVNADVLANTIEEYKTSLRLAQSVYKKQKKLWSKRVGSEIEYLKAKNSKQSLERKLATARSQLKQARIEAPFNGVVEQIQAKEGEFVGPGGRLLKIMSPDDMYLQADISEKYIGYFHAGDSVEIWFPSQDKKMASVLRAIGQVINSRNRTFEVEIELPKVDFPLSPNQVAILWLQDYYNEHAWTVPTKVIQKDNKGQFIFCVKPDGKQFIAKKQFIELGMTYGGKTEVLKGLTKGTQIVHEGFRELADGNEVSMATNKISSTTGG